MIATIRNRARLLGVSAGVVANPALGMRAGGQESWSRGISSGPDTQRFTLSTRFAPGAQSLTTGAEAGESPGGDAFDRRDRRGPRQQQGTLYHLTTDTGSMTTCTGSCAQIWRPLLAVNGKAPSVPGVMGTFGTLKRPDGSLQVTFDHKPLYTYAGDSRPGQANGQGIAGFFAVKV